MNYPRIITVVAGASIALATVGFAVAASHDAVEKRETAMKTVGKNAKTIGEMLKGEKPFDAAMANEALMAMKDAVANFGDYFPEGTALAGDDEVAAAPAIWEDREGFDKHIADFQADLASAVETAPQDKAAVAETFKMVAENCKACHEDYRVKK